jgi:hypothetical protein
VSASATAAEALALLAETAGPVLVVGRDAPNWEAVLGAAGRAVAAPGVAVAAAMVAFTGERGDPEARRRRLGDVRARLVAGAPLVLVDHNQPRQWWRRPLAAALLVARGLPPARGRYPAARELDAAGFRVVRLRLMAGERVQLVLARREA